jgi:UPF0716 protein FxsA
MMIRLLLLFTIVPTVELFLLLQLGALIGPTATVLLILVTGFVGAWLAKREGLGLLRTLANELQQGMPPGARLMEGALVVAGGLLLVTPGVFTDLTGFLFILPWSRRRLAPWLLSVLARRFQLDGAVELGPGRPSAGPRGPLGDAPVDHGRGPQPTPFSSPFD